MWWENFNTFISFASTCQKSLDSLKSQVSTVSIPLSLNFQQGLDWDSRSRQFKNLALTCRENFNTFKILVSTCQKSLDSLKSQVSTVSIPLSLNFQQGLDWDSRSRQFKNLALTCGKNLNTFRNLVSTGLDALKSQFSTRSQSRLSILTDKKAKSQRGEKISTLQKPCLNMSKKSRQLKNPSLFGLDTLQS